jgi:hypothetical protein
MISAIIDLPEDFYSKIAAIQNGVSFSDAVVQLAMLGAEVRARDQEDRQRMAAGETQIDFDALRRLSQGCNHSVPPGTTGLPRFSNGENPESEELIHARANWTGAGLPRDTFQGSSLSFRDAPEARQ